MPVNPALEGREYLTSEPMRVTREEIVAFADAVQAPSAAHRDETAAREAGFADIIAPPTFAVKFAQQAEALFMLDPESGVDYARLVHGEESFTHHAPITAGDVLEATTRVEKIRSAGGHDMVTLTTRVVTVDGERRANTTSTVVIRGEN